MEITKLLSQYLGEGVDGEELRQIALAALARRLRELKLAVGEEVVRAQGELMQGCLEGVDQALSQARKLGKEHHVLYRQWRELCQQEPPGPGPEAGAGPLGGEA
jgi:hypothetical protein